MKNFSFRYFSEVAFFSELIFDELKMKDFFNEKFSQYRGGTLVHLIKKKSKQRSLLFGNSLTLVISILAVPIIFAHSAFYADKGTFKSQFLI